MIMELFQFNTELDACTPRRPNIQLVDVLGDSGKGLRFCSLGHDVQGLGLRDKTSALRN